MVIEVQDDADALLLRLISDDIVLPNPVTTSKPPVLQFILRDPDWKALDLICKPLELYKARELQRRDDNRVISSLQKCVDRMTSTMADLEEVLSDTYLSQSREFVDHSNIEIDRLHTSVKTASQEAKAARRALSKSLLNYSVFSLKTSLR